MESFVPCLMARAVRFYLLPFSISCEENPGGLHLPHAQHTTRLSFLSVCDVRKAHPDQTIHCIQLRVRARIAWSDFWRDLAWDVISAFFRSTKPPLKHLSHLGSLRLSSLVSRTSRGPKQHKQS